MSKTTIDQIHNGMKLWTVLPVDGDPDILAPREVTVIDATRNWLPNWSVRAYEASSDTIQVPVLYLTEDKLFPDRNAAAESAVRRMLLRCKELGDVRKRIHDAAVALDCERSGWLTQDELAELTDNSG